jgi:hypothetical protein
MLYHKTPLEAFDVHNSYDKTCCVITKEGAYWAIGLAGVSVVLAFIISGIITLFIS